MPQLRSRSLDQAHAYLFKWLLKERVAIIGERALLQRCIAQLQAKLRKVEAVRLSSNLKSRQQRLTQTTRLISALDTNMGMSVRPENV